MIWILELEMLHLKQRCSVGYGTFNQITNMSMDDPNYAYLHCDLLFKAVLTTMILRARNA